MKPAMALLALFTVGCGESSGGPAPGLTPTAPNPVADSCPAGRPDFGGPATDADLALFSYDANAPLNLQQAVQGMNKDVEVSAITFSSPDGGAVTGLLLDPVTRFGLRPGIVLMHGMPGNAENMKGLGQQLASHGAIVIAIDAPFARRGGQAVGYISRDRDEQIQLIKDLQRAVDVLRGRPNVDANRIGYLGISYGGAMGALFVGVERRLKAAALVVGDGGLVSHSTGPEDVSLASLPCATRASWFEAMVPIEPIRFVGLASSALLLQNGRLDTLVPPADAELLHAAAPTSKTVLWYDAGHGLNQQAMFDRLDWLHQQLGIDPR